MIHAPSCGCSVCKPIVCPVIPLAYKKLPTGERASGVYVVYDTDLPSPDLYHWRITYVFGLCEYGDMRVDEWLALDTLP